MHIPSVNRVIFEEEESGALIKGVSFGLVPPGKSVSKTLYLASSGSPGTRVLDISIRTKIASTTESGSEDGSEILRTVSIPVIRPFSCTSQATYHRSTGALRSLLDLELFNQGEFDPRVLATVTSDIVNSGKWDVEVSSVKWVGKVSLKPYQYRVFLTMLQDGPRATLLSTSVGVEDDGSFPLGG